MGASLNPGLSGLFCFGRNSQEGKVSANWGGGLGSPRILQVLQGITKKYKILTLYVYDTANCNFAVLATGSSASLLPGLPKRQKQRNQPASLHFGLYFENPMYTVVMRICLIIFGSLSFLLCFASCCVSPVAYSQG
jgi:hypothetical protein